MKKYLMTGIAAIAMCAAFTSCSHDLGFEQTTQEDLDKAKYEAAFIARFGQPAADQDWGFGQFRAKAATRSHGNGRINVNGNEWEANGYTTPTLGPTEEADVVAYVNALTVYPKTAPTDLTTYFVTQVHEGTDEINTQRDLSNQGPYVGGNQMDELQFAMQASASIDADGKLVGDWEHINNFNSADDNDWGGNTLVENGGAYDFAYKSSVDSRYHNRWIGIDGALVPNAQGQLGEYNDYYYICFDFEATNPGVKTRIEVKWQEVKYNNGVPQYDNKSENVVIDGAYTIESAAEEGIQVTLTNKNNEKVTVGAEGFEWRVYQYDGGNKVIIGNNNYTDWIVRLTKASASVTPPTPPTPPVTTPDVRVIAEDLTVSEKGDFDFNDVVFDVYYNYNNTGKTAIELQAAGGTYPLYVAGHEVHLAFGQATNVMINTGAGPQLDPVLIPLDQAYTDANDILVQVDKGNGLETLTAYLGRAPHKIAVIPGFQIIPERQDIETYYKKFGDWVQDPQLRWY